MRKRIYIAGALNDQAAGYIQNLNTMIKYAEYVRKLGASVFVPGNDFLHGLLAGNHDYDDYFENSKPWLLVSDAVALVPGWGNSAGVRKEVLLARKNNIPVFYTFREVEKFLGV